ncbi:unnamed protein product [Blepharisma stoltei]|uniref:GPR180/TMEM145 transmembrane domain-containing protein n=1 Tax=Blepharisma stoltei TaxID=1481888 RepID=A0AAU9IMZ8_9CILI|nr:unnamed protein product [Blepharisma stoltei]
MIFLLLLNIVAAKLVSNTIYFSEEHPWKYLTKFAVDTGITHWQLKAKFAKPENKESADKVAAVFSIYIDDQLEEILSLQDCKMKAELGRRRQRIFIPRNGDWAEISGSFPQRKTPHIWYFSLSDCEGATYGEKLKVELHITDDSGSEFSLEDYGLIYLYPVVLLAFLLVLSKNLMRLIENFKATDDIQPAVLILNISIGCEFIGIISEIIHLWIYSNNGRGFFIFEFFYQALDTISALLITVLFIIMASGWTLKYKDFPEPDLAIPIIVTIIMLHLVIIGVGSITEDSYYHFSDYDGITGALLIFVRVALWAWFVYYIKSLYESVRGGMIAFVLNFSIIVSAYFLSLPILVVISWIFKTYLRNKIVTIGGCVIQIAVSSFLTHLFSKKSHYYKISTLSDSVLPGKIL